MQEGFTISGVPVDIEQPCPTLLLFLACMAAVVASRRGGKGFDYLPECADFMNDVTGTDLRKAERLPRGFDWTPQAAIDSANAMLEYDND